MSMGKFLLGTVIGGVIGAGIGMLLAPRSGPETCGMIKDELSNRYAQTKEKVSAEFQDRTELLRNKASAIGERVKQISEDLEDRGRRTLTQFNQPKTGESTN